jgi:PKD domain-containing protein/BNR/Asp-box repeat protein
MSGTGRRGGRWAALIVTGIALGAPSAHAAGTIPLPFVNEGPVGIFGTSSLSARSQPWSGAVTAVLPDPRNRDIGLVATVNGGLWRTGDLEESQPTWVAESDHAPSLSIASVSFDPTVGAGDRAVIAGIGLRSSLGRLGGLLTGLLTSTDGGKSWRPTGESALAGVNVSGAVMRGKVIAVTSRGGAASGVLVSTNAGATFTLLSGTTSQGHPEPPAGAAFDLVGDPRRPDRLYAGIGGAHGGVYRSDDGGRTWHAQGGPTFGTGRNLAKTAVNIRIAVHDSATTPSVWAAVAGPVPKAKAADDPGDDGEADGGGGDDDDNPASNGLTGDALDGLLRTVGTSSAWQALDVAKPTDPGLSINPGGQASVHLALTSDPGNASRVFVAGDRLPEGGGGSVIACNAALPRGGQCRRIVVHGTVDGSSPHPDTRSLAFNGSALLLGGDGGAYRDDDPNHPSRPDSRWTSLNADLGVTETHLCAWDSVRQRVVCGTQDNGTAEQRRPGALGWSELGGRDGYNLAIADGTGGSTDYWSAQRLGEFKRRDCTTATACTTASPALTIAGTNKDLPGLANIPNYDPMAADDLCPSRVSIFAGSLFESLDGAQTFHAVHGLGNATVTALEYSGTGCSDPARRLYAATSAGVFFRAGRGNAMTRRTGYDVGADGTPRALSVQPGNGRSVWLVSASKVIHITLGQSAASDEIDDVTGDLAGGGALSSIAVVPGFVSADVFVGTQNGIWMSSDADPGAWSKVSGLLPNALVESLAYDPVNAVLIAGTLGRGAWKLDHANDADVPPGITALAVNNAVHGTPLTVSGRWEDPDLVRFDGVSGTIDFGDGTGARTLTLDPDGHFTATHTYARPGHDTVTITLTDHPGAVTTKTITATIT